jgi:hypothetical protein
MGQMHSGGDPADLPRAPMPAAGTYPVLDKFSENGPFGGLMARLMQHNLAYRAQQLGISPDQQRANILASHPNLANAHGWVAPTAQPTPASAPPATPFGATPQKNYLGKIY